MMAGSRWVILIGLMAALAMAKVAQQTAVWLGAYAVGERAQQIHEMENQTAWLRTDVGSLQSPAHLVRVLRTQHKSLAAWSELPDRPRGVQVARLGRHGSASSDRR